MASQDGRCNCGSIALSLATVPGEVVACHCVTCRRSGGAFSINYFMDETEVTIQDTHNCLKDFTDKNTKSGTPAIHVFCKECGSSILTRTQRLPGKLIINASLFDHVAKKRRDVFVEEEIKWA